MDGNLSAADDELFGGVLCRKPASVKRALRVGADVNRRWGVDDTTPLMEACKQDCDEIVRILLDAGADARLRDDVDCSPVVHACSEGHLSIVEMLLNHDKDLLEIADKLGYTLLSVAVDYQQVDIVRFLLDRGANIHATSHDGTTPLMLACSGEDLAIVRLLLADAGLDVEARNENQQTALHDVARCGSVQAASALILEHNANMFVVDKDGNTPFDLIVQRPDNLSTNPTNTNPILDHFLDIYSNKMTQDHGRLALHAILGTAEYAFVENEMFHPPLKSLPEIRLPLGKVTLNHFRTLLSTLDPNLIRNRDENGKLPIHIVIRNKAPVEVLSMLVEMDAATLHIADDAGALPLHECCCGVVNDSIVRYLLEQGGVGTLSARTREGALPLHLLCGSTNPSWRTVQYMIQCFPGSVTARTNAGQYPFVIAACKSSTASLSVVYELARANPDLVISILKM